MESRLRKVLEWVSEKGWRIDSSGCMTNPKGEVRKGTVSCGYLKVGIRIAELGISSYALKVHKFQAYMKYGQGMFEPGIVVRHLNGDSLDNSWDNIVLGTQSENMMDRPKQERERHSRERKSYSAETRRELVREREGGRSFGEISKAYSIPLQTVKDITRNPRS